MGRDSVYVFAVMIDAARGADNLLSYSPTSPISPAFSFNYFHSVNAVETQRYREYNARICIKRKLSV